MNVPPVTLRLVQQLSLPSGPQFNRPRLPASSGEQPSTPPSRPAWRVEEHGAKAVTPPQPAPEKRLPAIAARRSDEENLGDLPDASSGLPSLTILLEGDTCIPHPPMDLC